MRKGQGHGTMGQGHRTMGKGNGQGYGKCIGQGHGTSTWEMCMGKGHGVETLARACHMARIWDK